jgi:hypothetical protein
MRSMRMLLVSVVLLSVAAGPALAVDITGVQTGTSDSHASYTTGVRDITVWCQVPELVDWAKLSSQIDTAYPFDSGCAEDYVSATDYALTYVQWWGGNWNFSTLAQPDYFVITFYQYSGCTPPDPAPVAPDFLPNNYYYQTIVTDYSVVTLDAANYIYEYGADIGPVLQDAGTTYFIEIQAGMFFNPYGQWGWMSTSDPRYGCRIQRGFPLLGNPYWYPDPDYNGTAFCLYSDQSVATQAETFGAVKSLYR